MFGFQSMITSNQCFFEWSQSLKPFIYDREQAYSLIVDVYHGVPIFQDMTEDDEFLNNGNVFCFSCSAKKHILHVGWQLITPCQKQFRRHAIMVLNRRSASLSWLWLDGRTSTLSLLIKFAAFSLLMELLSSSPSNILKKCSFHTFQWKLKQGLSLAFEIETKSNYNLF